MTALQFVDTHIHLDDAQFDDDRDAVIDAAIAAGIVRLINIGYEPGVWETTLALADRRPEIGFVLGLHPGSTDKWSRETFAALSDLVRSRRPLAIGEIGLDYYWTQENKAQQRESFERQIELALDLALPIVIHQRSAATDVRAVLSSAPQRLRVILHSFDGDPALADLAEERGWFLGVGGLATRRQAEELRDRLTRFPIDQLLLETDAPYLIPAGIKERRNVPANIPIIAGRLAGLTGRPVDEIARVTTANAERAFAMDVVAHARS
ncbi:MAG: TatD family hydrolase [Chloroflexota bacterium]|nr:TatD family hydrolase [Chloroflexota bacterium]